MFLWVYWCVLGVIYSYAVIIWQYILLCSKYMFVMFCIIIMLHVLTGISIYVSYHVYLVYIMKLFDMYICCIIYMYASMLYTMLSFVFLQVLGELLVTPHWLWNLNVICRWRVAFVESGLRAECLGCSQVVLSTIFWCLYLSLWDSRIWGCSASLKVFFDHLRFLSLHNFCFSYLIYLFSLVFLVTLRVTFRLDVISANVSPSILDGVLQLVSEQTVQKLSQSCYNFLRNM